MAPPPVGLRSDGDPLPFAKVPVDRLGILIVPQRERAGFPAVDAEGTRTAGRRRLGRYLVQRHVQGPIVGFLGDDPPLLVGGSVIVGGLV